MSKYEDLQGHIEAASLPISPTKAHLFNNDLIDAAITTIVFCVLVATIFGADFFFLVFWPSRTYPRWYQTSKKVAAVVISAGVFAAAIVSTVCFRITSYLSEYNLIHVVAMFSVRRRKTKRIH